MFASEPSGFGALLIAPFMGDGPHGASGNCCDHDIGPVAEEQASSTKTPMPFELLSLPSLLTRVHALESLLAASTVADPDAELCLNARGVEKVDVVAATATRMRLARHQRLHPQGHASIWLPERAPIAARYTDLLSPLPAMVAIDQLPQNAAPAHYTLVPATQIPDGAAARLAGEYVFDACRRARISRRRAGYIAAAVVELADNAVTHAKDAPDYPVLAVTSLGRERIVEIAVTDAGTTVSEAEDPLSLVRDIPGRAIAGEPGFLGQILRRGKEAGVDVTVHVLAGVAHLTWTTAQHRTVRGRHVPGMTVVLRIGA